MTGKNNAVFDNHVGALVLGIEQHRMLLRIGDIRGGASEDTAIVWHLAIVSVRVRCPIELPIHEIDAA